MSHGSLTLAPIEVTWNNCEPTPLELSYVSTVIQKAGLMVPDLSKHVSKIIIRPAGAIPPKAYEVMDDDEIFMLNFITGSGRYLWPHDPDGIGWIEIDYMPYVDFVVGLLCHEMAHALDRASDPERLRLSRKNKVAMQKHHQSWSDKAVMLYQMFGCEKAALFYDGMSYRSTRKRHTRMVPSEAEWLWRVWGLFDQQEFGTLRQEFTNLFVIS